MQVRPLESLTKEELIELIKQERDHIEQPLVMVPEGFKLVPVEPTESMLEAGADVEVLAFGEKHTFREVSRIYAAMLAADPQPDHIPDATKMVDPTPTPTQIVHWLAEHEAQLSRTEIGDAGPDHYELEYYIDDELGWRFITGPDPLALILEEMK